MKKIRILLIISFSIGILTVSCTYLSGPIGEVGQTTLYKIGDIGPSGVGIVFYITNGGSHGLEAAPTDQAAGSGKIWCDGFCAANVIGTSTAIGTGLANTNLIVSYTTNSAAFLCRDYKGGGKTDWFLPSYNELILLYMQRNVVGGFIADFYWSSSEASPSTVDAWIINFLDGSNAQPNKSGNYFVRPVRAF